MNKQNVIPNHILVEFLGELRVMGTDIEGMLYRDKNYYKDNDIIDRLLALVNREPTLTLGEIEEIVRELEVPMGNGNVEMVNSDSILKQSRKNLQRKIKEEK